MLTIIDNKCPLCGGQLIVVGEMNSRRTCPNETDMDLPMHVKQDNGNGHFHCYARSGDFVLYHKNLAFTIREEAPKLTFWRYVQEDDSWLRDDFDDVMFDDWSDPIKNFQRIENLLLFS